MKLPDWIAKRFSPALPRADGAAEHYNLGCRLRDEGRLEAAIASFSRALELDPAMAQAARNLAVAWLEHGDPDQAEYFTRLAIGLEPSSAGLYVHLGIVIKTLKREAEAIAEFRKALELDPALAAGHANLGIAMHEAGRLGEAEQYYRAALRLDPRLAQVSRNLGFLLEGRGEAASAIECYDAAIALQPEFADAHVNRALQRLLKGDFAAGWEEYEWRWRLPHLAGRDRVAGSPRWDGSRLDGRTILLSEEQGFGDAIQFVRYALPVAEMGAKVLLRCEPELKSLLSGAAGVTAVFDASQALPPFDVCCPLMSLPGIFRTTRETIPRSVPYLHARDAAVTRWRERIGAAGAGVRVGLVWASSSANKTAALRSLTPGTLAPLASVRGVSFYSLQKGAAAASDLPPGLRITDWTEELQDFAETAAFIANLDLVISIDTAVAHLAGAMAKPVWTLIRHPGEWRWLEEREDSPWYPGMRLFRQSPGEPWTEVLARVAEALSALPGQREGDPR
jgi:tetratricopeptide (TPR) repeat protein